jgi:hypothetical protein
MAWARVYIERRIIDIELYLYTYLCVSASLKLHLQTLFRQFHSTRIDQSIYFLSLQISDSEGIILHDWQSLRLH